MPMFVPDEERLDRRALDPLQRRKLARLLAEIVPTNRFYARKLAGREFDPLHDSITDLPFTTRSELHADQAANPPFGTNLTYPLTRYSRFHQTSGSQGIPLRWLDTAESWEWWKRCWAIVLWGAGVRPEDRLAFLFSFGPFIGFWSAFESAAMLGNLCLPAGGMSTAARIRYVMETGVTVVCCTPTYALHAAEVARQESVDLAASRVRLLIVAGEPGGSIPATRERIESAWGARVIDHAGATEVGAWGFEPAESPGAGGGLLVTESEFIAESVDPKSGAPVADGEIGELVLTNLGRLGSPVIRYRTGDLVRILRDGPRAGRHFAWLEGGILGRADDMLIIRGNNVFPAAIEGIVRTLPEVAEFRLNVSGRGALAELRIEVEAAAGADAAGLAARVSEAVRERLLFRPEVAVVPAGTLPRFEMKARRLVRH